MRNEAVSGLRWVDVDGGACAVVDHGDPAGPPVVVLPGLSDGLLPIFDPDAKAAATEPPEALRDRHVLLVSHRRPLPDRVTTCDLACDVVQLIEQQALGPVALSGHSMGAMIAQHVAAGRPDLVRALVLSAAVPRADLAMERILLRWERWLQAGEERRFLRDALAVSYTGSELLRRRLLLRLQPVRHLGERIDRHLALSHACRTHDARDRLANIQAPTLVLAGRRDPLTRIEGARELAAGIADARLVELPGLAHGFPEQARGRYVRELVAFLDA